MYFHNVQESRNSYLSTLSLLTWSNCTELLYTWYLRLSLSRDSCRAVFDCAWVVDKIKAVKGLKGFGRELKYKAMRKTAIRKAATKIDFCFLCPTMKLPQDSPPTFARIADKRNIKCVTLLHAFKNTCPFQFIVHFRNSSENSGSSSSIVPSPSVRWCPFQKRRWRFDETCDFTTIAVLVSGNGRLSSRIRYKVFVKIGQRNPRWRCRKLFWQRPPNQRGNVKTVYKHFWSDR